MMSINKEHNAYNDVAESNYMVYHCSFDSVIMIISS